MTDKERITNLEERLARAEGRVAELEARPNQQIVIQPQLYPVYPQPHYPHWYQQPYYVTCGSNYSDPGMTITA